MSRILIAGGAGFIGSHLSEKLVEKDHKVVAIDNLCSSNRENVENLEDNRNFQLIEKDILEDFEIEGEIDYVLHFASRSSPKDYRENPIHTLRTNTEGTLNLLELADRKNAKFMFASTSEVYGEPEHHPQPEDYWGNVNPTGPRSSYTEGKRCGESYVSHYAEQNNIDYRIVRIFNTYGPRLQKTMEELSATSSHRL